MADNASSPPSRPSRTGPFRSLVLSMVFSMFVSVSVFSVASYVFLVPHMYEQKQQLEAMKERVRELDERARSAEEALAASLDEEFEEADLAAAGDEAGGEALGGEPSAEGANVAAAVE